MSVRSRLLSVLLSLLTATNAAAQTAQVGQIAGNVRDTTDGALRSVKLTLISEDRGVMRTATTDHAGRFVFAGLPPGRYTIEVRHPSFEAANFVENVVEAEKTTNIAIRLRLANIQEATNIVGEVPVVDRATQTQQIRLRAAEFEKMPYTRSYQALISQTPGLVYNTDGNPNSHGALRSNNFFMFDGVNTTDPTTGTVGNSLNFEAIQEVLVRTSAISAEFRGSGAIVDVITKAGTNRLQGSFKYLIANDHWNAANTTRSEVAGSDGSFASLARTRFNRINPTLSGTVGGPVLKNAAWFFVAFERAENASAERQTNAAPGFTAENYQQITTSPYYNVRVTAQLAPAQQVWAKVVESPTRGFVNDYWGGAAERFALTSQNQGGRSWAVQYAGVLGAKWMAEVMGAAANSFINVVPYLRSPLSNGAPYQDQVDGRMYNGATFDGFVRRPRQQASGAMTVFMTAGHQLKFGADWQSARSESAFRFPTSSLFLVTGFNPATREFTPIARLDFDDEPSQSTGTNTAFYVRDRMQFARANVEGGVRVERHRAKSDVGDATVDTLTYSPRVSVSVAMSANARHLLVGSFGRLYDPILLGYSDAFAQVPQQTNYDLFLWTGSEYTFDSRFEEGAGAFAPDTSIRPRRMDEFTIGSEHKVGLTGGFAIRYVERKWTDFIDDVVGFNGDGSISRRVENVPDATRSYRGLEIMFDRRFANNWTASGSYSFGQVRGNHFADDFSAVGDFVNDTCEQSVDPGLGDARGRFPCRDVQANLLGRPAYDRPHMIKFNGAYAQRIGGVDVTVGFVGNVLSKTAYTKSRTVNVLQPNSLTASGQTLTYFYEPRGTDRLPGFATTLDLAFEAAFRFRGRSNAGVKFDLFNVLDAQGKINVNNTAWCSSTSAAVCGPIVDTYGTATTRGSFQAPRSMRLTFLMRWN